MTYTPNCSYTGIGSLPFKDPQTAVTAVLDNFPEIPFWPQLPKRDLREEMYFQYLEGFPGLVFTPEDKKAYFRDDDQLFEELARFFEDILASEDCELPISPEFASGLWELKSRESEIRKLNLPFVKGHIVGPVSLGFTLTVNQQKPLFYHDNLMEAALMGLKSKIRFQVNMLRRMADQVIIFVDEPYLASFGSGVLNMPKEKVKTLLREISREIGELNCRSGLHCCGNTDWETVLGLGFDIVNFDAFNYGENFIIYTEAIKKYLADGGFIAWGAVPTTETPVELEEVCTRLENLFAKLEAKGIPKTLLLQSSLLTPSCGMGTLCEDRTFSIMQDLRELSTRFKQTLSRNGG